MRAFYLNLSTTELVKSLNTKKSNDRIPEIDEIASTLKQSFQAMLNSQQLGKLVSSSDLKKMRQNGFNINYLLWHAMMRDLDLSNKTHFYFPPYDSTLINAENSEDDCVDKKRSKIESGQGTLETITLSSMMGETSNDKAKRESISKSNSTTPTSNKKGEVKSTTSNVLESSSGRMGSRENLSTTSSPKGANLSSKKIPLIVKGQIYKVQLCDYQIINETSNNVRWW